MILLTETECNIVNGKYGTHSGIRPRKILVGYMVNEGVMTDPDILSTMTPEQHKTLKDCVKVDSLEKAMYPYRNLPDKESLIEWITEVGLEKEFDLLQTHDNLIKDLEGYAKEYYNIDEIEGE